MNEKISALLVHDQAEPLAALKRALESQLIKTFRARSCGEASRLLARANAPLLIFSQATLPDGTWADVVSLARKAPEPVNVIVVAPVADTKLYIEAIEGGAFDFITPPFAGSDLTHVVRCAADDVIVRREGQARAEQSQRVLVSPSQQPGYFE